MRVASLTAELIPSVRPAPRAAPTKPLPNFLPINALIPTPAAFAAACAASPAAP